MVRKSRTSHGVPEDGVRSASEARGPLELDVFGTVCRIDGDTDALARLAIHFSPFVSQVPLVAPAIELRLHAERRSLQAALSGKRLGASQVVDRGIVYNSGPVTWVDHHGTALSMFNFETNRGEIWADSLADRCEMAYLMLHARLGPRLEASGWVRVHGLGVVVDNTASVLLTPSGGGKSRLALALLDVPGVKLLSDDVVLVDRRGQAKGFPMPLGVSSPALGEHLGVVHRFERRRYPTKYLVDLDSLRDRIAFGTYPVSTVGLVTRVSAPSSRVIPCSRHALLGPLWRDAVVGLGLPQVLEFVARHGASDILAQAPSAARRSLAMGAMLRGAQGAHLEVFDPPSAAEEWIGFMRSTAR